MALLVEGHTEKPLSLSEGVFLFSCFSVCG